MDFIHDATPIHGESEVLMANYRLGSSIEERNRPCTEYEAEVEKSPTGVKRFVPDILVLVWPAQLYPLSQSEPLPHRMLMYQSDFLFCPEQECAILTHQ